MSNVGLVVLALLQSGAVAETKVEPCPEGTTYVTDGKTPLGPVREWCETTARPNVRHGRFLSRYPGGALRAFLEYRDGVLEGDATNYYEDGKPKSRGRFKAGKYDGAWKF